MIQLSGLKLRDENNIKGDIDILITGLRPREKLYEEFIENNSISTDHPKILKHRITLFLGLNYHRRLKSWRK